MHRDESSLRERGHVPPRTFGLLTKGECAVSSVAHGSPRASGFQPDVCGNALYFGSHARRSDPISRRARQAEKPRARRRSSMDLQS